MDEPARATVLVVDDDPDIRFTVTAVLQEEGYRVLEAANGREALEALENDTKPSAILLDLMMPIMDGLQVLDALARRAAWQTIPVAIVTAFADQDLPGRDPPGGSHSLRGRRVIRKPFSIDDLLRIVKELCFGRDSSDPNRRG